MIIFLALSLIPIIWSYEFPQEKFDGKILVSDVMLTESQYDTMFGNGSIGRNAVASAKWPNGIVPYKIASNFDSYHRNRIKKGIAYLNDNLKGCINVRPKKSSDKHYVSIEKDYSSYCHAFLGFSGGKHVINLVPGWSGSDYCTSKFVVAHEMVHGLGLWHEQQRPDRDDYIWVDFSNIASGSEAQYDKCQSCLTYNIPYDPHSIMHYPPYSYCKDCSKLVMHSKIQGVKSEDLGGTTFTANDIEKLKRMYGCDDGSGSSTPGPSTTTPSTGNCQDNHENCGLWANAGYCEETYVNYMQKNCKKSCGLCSITACKNKWSTKKCKKRKKKGRCNKKNVKQNCQKTCGFCGNRFDDFDSEFE